MTKLWSDWVEPGHRDDPVVTPLFGCQPFTPHTTCDDIHHGPMPKGSRCVCMVDHCVCNRLETRLSDELAETLAQQACEAGRGVSKISEAADKQRRRSKKRHGGAAKVV